MVKKISSSQKIEKLSTRITELETNYKRVLADYQNQERRHKEKEAQIIKFASAALIEKLLLDLDSLELAQKHLQDAGLAMVIKQLFETLQTEGLQLIESDGKLFDPLTMDCIEVVPGQKDHVIETLNKGYFLFDKVLRPAKVKVGSGEK